MSRRKEASQSTLDLALERTEMLGSYAEQFQKTSYKHCNVSIRNPIQIEPHKHLESIS